jgi:hypothetical protein
METLFWEYPSTAGDLPFGTAVGKNIFAPLHDHLTGDNTNSCSRLLDALLCSALLSLID